MEPKEQLGINLLRLRSEAGLTQLELSLRSGLDTAEISKLERGLNDARLSTLVKVAAGLDVDTGDLVGGITLAA